MVKLELQLAESAANLEHELEDVQQALQIPVPLSIHVRTQHGQSDAMHSGRSLGLDSPFVTPHHMNCLA